MRGTAILRSEARQSRLLSVDNVLLLMLWLLQRLKRHDGSEVSKPRRGWRWMLPDEAVRHAVTCHFGACLLQATKPFCWSVHWTRIHLSYRITKVETPGAGEY